MGRSWGLLEASCTDFELEFEAETLKIVIFHKENANCQENLERGNATFLLKTIEKSQFFETIDFVAILERFGEARIFNFRIVFDVFSMQNLKCVRESEKMHQKSEKCKVRSNFGSGLQCS